MQKTLLISDNNIIPKKIIKGEVSRGFDPDFKYKYFDWLKKLNDNPSEALDEIKRDPIKFISYSCKTDSRDKQTGLDTTMLLELHEHQKDFVKLLHKCVVKAKPMILGKSRQQGASWITAAYIFYRCVCYKKQKILITSKNEKTLHVLGDLNSYMEKITFFMDNMHEYVRACLFTSDEINDFYKNKKRFFFKIKTSQIRGGDDLKDPGRGGHHTLTINDEFSFNNYQEEVIKSISPGCKANIYISTLRRPMDLFNIMWNDNNGSHEKFILHWSKDPQILNKEDWKMRTIAEVGKPTFDIEYDMKFTTTGELYVFPLDLLDPARLMTTDKKPYGKRIAGWDVAFEGNDYNCLTVRQGTQIIFKKKWRGVNVFESLDMILRLNRTSECVIDYLIYDDLGAGISVTNEIRRRIAHHQTIPFPIKGVTALWKTGHELNKRSKKKIKISDEVLSEDTNIVFLNKRAMLHWKLKRIIENMNVPEKYRDPNMMIYGIDNDLYNEMSVITGSWENGKIKIISKENLRNSVSKGGIGRSPDSLDSLLLTYAADDIMRRQEKLQKLYLSPQQIANRNRFNGQAQPFF